MDYTEKFEELVKEQLKRIEKLKNEPPATDFSKLDKIIIGFVDGMMSSVVILSPAQSTTSALRAPPRATLRGNGLIFGPIATGVFSLLESFG